MDFMKIIKSLEALLYELMVWLVFYPLTLWKAVVHPLALTDYADEELEDADEDRYSDTLSPPIFLAISLGLVHLVEMITKVNLATEGLLADDRNIIAFRLVAYALFPLMLSLRLLRLKGIALDRKALRPPFYAQCFVAAPFAIALNGATVLIGLSQSLVEGLVVMAIAFTWYVWVQARWFAREAGISVLRGAWNAVRAIVFSLVVVLILSIAVDQIG